MPIEVVAGSLVEVLAAISFSMFSLCLFGVVVVYRDLHIHLKCSQWPVPQRCAYLAGEQRSLITMTWLVACAVVAVLLSIFFAEVYEAEDDTNSAPVILSLLVLDVVLMMFWVLTQSLWSRTPTRWPLAWLLCAFALAIVETALVFTTLHESHWYHWLVILLYVAPIMAAFASNGVVVYRTTIAKISSALVGGDDTDSSLTTTTSPTSSSSQIYHVSPSYFSSPTSTPHHPHHHHHHHHQENPIGSNIVTLTTALR